MNVADINFSTTRIEIIKKGTSIGTATGFFFRDGKNKFLVTNRHVVIDEKKNHIPDQISINLHSDKQNITINNRISILLYNESKRSIWLQHPNYAHNQCDVVMIPLDNNTLNIPNYRLFNTSIINFISTELINKEEVNSFANVVIVGYPLGFYDEVNNLPVYRKASMASSYGVNFNGLPYFLVDANLHPGTSGSPVVNSHHTLFKKDGVAEGYKLFGIHSAQHVVRGKELGLNVVWYAHLLEEISAQ